jgi:hypothetical protein
MPLLPRIRGFFTGNLLGKPCADGRIALHELSEHAEYEW